MYDRLTSPRKSNTGGPSCAGVSRRYRRSCTFPSFHTVSLGVGPTGAHSAPPSSLMPLRARVALRSTSCLTPDRMSPTATSGATLSVLLLEPYRQLTDLGGERGDLAGETRHVAAGGHVPEVQDGASLTLEDALERTLDPDSERQELRHAPAGDSVLQRRADRPLDLVEPLPPEGRG